MFPQLLSLALLLLSSCAYTASQPLFPISGTKKRFPTTRTMTNMSRWGGDTTPQQTLGYHDIYNRTDLNLKLARLLDVAGMNGSIQYVPALDGTTAEETQYFWDYAMKFVLYDVKLVNLKDINPTAGTFTAQIEIILQWEDWITPDDANATEVDSNCKFLCDTTSPSSLCCDNIWVPRLRIPKSEIKQVDSILTAMPSVYWGPRPANFSDCHKKPNNTPCFWKRFWKLNIAATYDAQFDFVNFPFDTQRLTIEILNPFSSRTLFQHANGTLLANGGVVINGIFPQDNRIPNWYIRDVLLNSTCDVQSWYQTFLTQDDLLEKMSVDGSQKYSSQQFSIERALQKGNLKCSELRGLNVSGRRDLANPNNWDLYEQLSMNYFEHANATFSTFDDCVQKHGKDYYLKNDPKLSGDPFVPEIHNRLFGLFDFKQGNATKVAFNCSIQAVANLTTPGIKLIILVGRYRGYSLIKLVIPTIACVAFAFTTFAIHPEQLIERLTVLVPSAIALSALQVVLVGSDVPAISYIVSTTNIILISYITQVLISFESIIANKFWRAQKPKSDPNSGSQERGAHDKLIRKMDIGFMIVLAMTYIVGVVTLLLIASIRESKKVPTGVSIFDFKSKAF